MGVLASIVSLSLVSCATVPQDRYNTQAGAVVGAGTGALLGAAIGGNAESALIGLGAGTIIGALVGNAMDQDVQAARDAAQYGKPVIYYDSSGRAVEAIPESATAPNCQKVRRQTWENGQLVKETVEEVCSSPPPVAQYYYSDGYAAPYYTTPPPPYYYGWWGYPSFSFYFGRPYFHRGWRHW